MQRTQKALSRLPLWLIVSLVMDITLRKLLISGLPSGFDPPTPDPNTEVSRETTRQTTGSHHGTRILDF
jgi:hypothetical protein